MDFGIYGLACINFERKSKTILVNLFESVEFFLFKTGEMKK